MYNLNQNIKSDQGKLKLSLAPTQIIKNIALVREYGIEKYGDKESWKSVDIQRYKDAAYRHFLAYIDDSGSIDEESGLPHLYHLACNIAFLSELEKFEVFELISEGKVRAREFSKVGKTVNEMNEGE